MSSTPSSALSGSSWNGAARRTQPPTASTVCSSMATAATSCWARTSSGLSGTTSGSMSPARIRSLTTAASSRSPRCLGKIRPTLTSPTAWPARPTRCSPRATEPGDSTSTTRSIAPMSMPSSSELVATMARSAPLASACSTRRRSAWDRLPWCDITSSSPARSLSRWVSRSHRPRLLTNTSVDRCARISSIRRGWMAGQMPFSPGRVSSGGAGRSSSGRVMSATGTTMRRSRRGGAVVSTTDTGRSPPRKRATSAVGRAVADSPMRCGSRAVIAHKRSSDSAR